MHITDLKNLQCVDCRGDLTIDYPLDKDEFFDGLLYCNSCGRNYPILDNVGVFFRKDVLRDYLTPWEEKKIIQLGFDTCLPNWLPNKKTIQQQIDVANNWEYQWEKFYPYTAVDLDSIDEYFSENNFFSFIPIEPEANLLNKVVLIACGGRGREAYHVAKYLPQKIFMMEIGAEIYSASKILPNQGNRVVLLRCDISYHPLKDATIDTAICDHALQHVYDHRLAFNRLADTLRPKGIIGICVYSWENNFLMTHIIEPFKPILHYFSLKTQSFIALFPAIVVFLVIHILYGSIDKMLPAIAKRLPLYEHMMFWKPNRFKVVWTSCFDLIHAPISYHFKKEEIWDMCRSRNLIVEKLTHTHRTTWSLTAKVKSTLSEDGNSGN